MRILIFVIISFFVLPTTNAQESANDLMQRVKNNFVNQDQMAFDFNLTVKIPEQKDISLNGSIIRSGSKFSASLGERWIKTDGNTQWVYDPDLGEVQIYDASEENALPLSPEEILKVYNSDDFAFEIRDEMPAEDDQLYLIEFKPRDKSSQVVKASMKVYKSSAIPTVMKVSERDGMQYELEIKNIDTKPSISPDEFTFNSKNYPNLKTEDLRVSE